MNKGTFGRRQFLVSSAVAATASVAGILNAKIHDGELGAPPRVYQGGMPWTEGAADEPPGVSDPDGPFRFFTHAERVFIEAAVDRLIPHDDVGPGAIEAGVPIFIDRQLAGPFGRGDHYFLGGPWAKGTPEQGYQLRFSPAQLYRAAIASINAYTHIGFDKQDFSQLQISDRERVLSDMESGKVELDGGVDARTFFAMLLQNTKEGYFSDPIYGGNKNMGGWRMIGFPGAHYDYREWVSRHGEPVPFEPVGFKGRPGWSSET